MSRFCQHCGNELAANETFCQRCGTNCNSNSAAAPAPQQNTYQQPYQVQQNTVPEMTTGQWVGTYILCTWFGIISIILCIVWGFADNGPKTAKKNFCRAMLIINIIGIVIGIIFGAIFFGVLATAGDDIFDALRRALN